MARHWDSVPFIIERGPAGDSFSFFLLPIFLEVFFIGCKLLACNFSEIAPRRSIENGEGREHNFSALISLKARYSQFMFTSCHVGNN